MRKSRKSLKKLSACILAAAMTVTLAAPFSPLAEVKAAGEEAVNLAIGATATASESESGTQYTAAKAIDGNADRDVEKAQQSRWATNQLDGERDAWLQVKMNGQHWIQSFVIVWERTNITNYKIQVTRASDPQEDDWETVYTKEGSEDISGEIENIHLPAKVAAESVRLYVEGYNGGTSGWQSVSVYEFQIYEDQIQNEFLPEENYNLEGTAEASDYEPTDDNRQVPDKAIDGDQTTRWATNMSSSEEARTLTVTLPASQRVQFFRIIWERLNIESYKIEVAESDNAEFKEVCTKADPITSTNEVISLDAPVWAKKIRLTVDGYNGGDNNWPNVSVAEFESYAVEPASISADATPEEVADLLGAPSVNADGTALILPEVPEGFTVEFLADYEEVVGKDGTIYAPLTDKTVKGIYKVTKGEESAEGSVEYTVEIPGRYDGEGANAKPTVIPELAEWYGGESAGSFSVANDAGVYAPADFFEAAEAFVEDYNAETGAELKIVSDASAAAIVFEKDSENGLGEEGYIMDIGSDKLTVKADHNTGAYWATRSILQITELNDGKIPTGITKDYPKYEVRGFMLDVARKPVSMETLQDIAKEMAYYKMNEFHLHLNDNLIFYEDYASAEEARELAYTGFRLESDVVEGSNGGLNQADLTNEDLYYTKDEFRSFILDSRSMGVKITPEFDTPGHSGAFTKVRPDLMLQDIVSGAANRAGEQFDLSPEKYDESLAFVESIWDEYLNEDMFDKSMTVHIGTDEYYGEKNRFRMFSDDLIEYIQSKGYTVRLWGSLSSMPGDADVRSEGVQMNVWNTQWAKPTDMYNEGFELINTIDGSLYIVPAAGYYYDYLNTQNLYNNWTPNNFSGTVIPAGSEQMLGSTYAIWNDSVDTRANGISEVDIYDRFADAVPTMASKNWGEAQDQTWADMEATVDELGDAANSNPYHKASADDNGEYMSYEFEDGSEMDDSSENGRDLKENVNASIEDGSLKLNGGKSYVETPVDKLATGNTLEFDITLDKEAQAGDILFEADNEGSNDDYAHTIQIMDDGRLGFRRELYDYYFDYTIPVGEKVHLVISTDGTKTTLIADGESYPAVGKYVNRQTDNEERVDNIGISTLLLPLQRIGSETNAISAVIDNVKVLSGAYKDKTVIDNSNFTVTSDNENPLAGSEGPIELAFDGDTSTFWHSNYTPYQGLPATVEIDMGQVYTINKFSYLPRQSGTNGIITEYSLYYKTSADGEWIPLAEEQTWAGDSSQKTVKFDAVETQYLKFVALDGMSDSDKKFASAAEFMVHQVLGEEPEPEVTHTVTFIADGNKTTQTVKDGETADEPEKPTKAGHEFLGWFAEGSETAFDFEQPITGDVTLTARFEAYTVTPSTDANGTVSAGAMQADGSVTVEAEPNSGYRFAGWKVNDQIVSNDNPYTFVPDQDTVITAKFEKIETPGEGDSDQDKPGTDKPGADTQKPGSGNADKGDKGGSTAVQTGDQSSPVIWAVVLIVAVAAVAAVVIIRKKKK